MTGQTASTHRNPPRPSTAREDGKSDPDYLAGALAATRRAIAAHSAALEAAAEACRALSPRDDLANEVECALDDWRGFGNNSDVTARDLVRAIAIWSGLDAGKCIRAEGHRWPAHAIVVDGTTFVAYPDPDSDEDPDGTCTGTAEGDIMLLAVVGPGRVTDLDAIAGPAAPTDDDAPLDDPAPPADLAPPRTWKYDERPDPEREPGPEGPRLAPKGPWHDRPLPLLRATHTIALPSDPWPVTLEVVVLAEAQTDDDRTATVADVPELKQGGWSNHGVGPLSVFTRLIC